jgi:hypothetical protein
MPLVTLESNKIISHDVNSVFAEVYGGAEWKSPTPKAFREFKISFGGNLPDGLVKQDVTDKYLIRGNKNITKGYFETTPVFRVPFEDLSRTEQLRVLTYVEGIWELSNPRFDREVAKNVHNVLYEPSPLDIQKARGKVNQDLSMPTFALDVFFGGGYITKAKKIVRLPGAPTIEDTDTMCTEELEILLCEMYLERKSAKAEKYLEYSRSFDEIELGLADKLELADLEKRALNYAKSVTGTKTEPVPEPVPVVAASAPTTKSSAKINTEDI